MRGATKLIGETKFIHSSRKAILSWKCRRAPPRVCRECTVKHEREHELLRRWTSGIRRNEFSSENRRRRCHAGPRVCTRVRSRGRRKIRFSKHESEIFVAHRGHEKPSRTTASRKDRERELTAYNGATRRSFYINFGNLSQERSRVTGKIYGIYSPHGLISFNLQLCYVQSSGSVQSLRARRAYNDRDARKLLEHIARAQYRGTSFSEWSAHTQHLRQPRTIVKRN